MHNIVATAFLILSIAVLGKGQLVYFTNKTLPSTSLTTQCVAALTASIASCNSVISRWLPFQYHQETDLMRVCTAGCETALTQWQSSVRSACNGQTYHDTQLSTAPVSQIPDLFEYTYNRTCLEDQGRFCNAWAYNNTLTSNGQVYGANGTNGTSPPGGANPCDTCLVRTYQFDAESDFFGGPGLAPQYSSFTSSCHVTGFPLSTTRSAPSVTTTMSSTHPSCTGTTYAISSGDTCESISKSQKTSTTWLLLDNGLEAFCADFPKSGNLCVNHPCTTYTVQNNDTCSSIAYSHNLTFAQIVSWNPQLDVGCATLNKSTNFEICVSKPGSPYLQPSSISFSPTIATSPAPVPTNLANGTNKDCGMYYSPVQGDYCNLVVLKYSISLDDFIFLNPEINANCTNLLAGESYCVEPVGDINNYPGHSGYVTPTTTFSKTPFSSFPTATYIPAPVNVTSTPQLPLANGTQTGCYIYVNGGDYTNRNTNDGAMSNGCQALCNGFEITLDTLHSLNPSLNTSDPNCSFNNSYRYCALQYGTGSAAATTTAGAAAPTRSGTRSNCTDYWDAEIPDTCQTILKENNINISQFYAWNPSVGSDCSGLWLGYTYCVRVDPWPTDGSNQSSAASTTATSTTSSSSSAPTETQAGQPSDCNRWYTAQSGDTCISIENTYGLSSSTFISWNPAVKQDCSGLWLGYAYCVGTTSQAASTTPSPTKTTASSTTTASLPPASQTQANNYAKNCNKYGQAMAQNDNCSAFAQRNGITTTQLYSWNAVLGNNGQNCNSQFWAQYWYCTGVSS